MSKIDSSTIQILHIEGRRSFRVIWLCEELDVPYVLRFIQGDVSGSLQAIRDAYPTMPLAPTVKIGERYIVESGAILDVLVARDPARRLIPPVESDDFLLHTQWMHFAEGTLASKMQLWRFTAMTSNTDIGKLPAGYRPAGGGAAISSEGISAWLGFLVGPKGCFDAMEEHLAAHPYFGGATFTAADIMIHFLVRGARLLSGINLADFPNIQRWRDIVETRRAFSRAEAAATPGGANEHGLPLGMPLPFKLETI